MREIEFRGKCLNMGQWIYGSCIINVKESIYQIVHRQGINLTHHSEVLPETIGQYTGLKDKNGTKIFEGDILKGGIINMQIVFKQEACQFWMIWKDINGIKRYEPLNATYGDDTDYFSNDSLEVICNIHDNPELLNID